MTATGEVWSGERTTFRPFESFSHCTGIPSPPCCAAGFWSASPEGLGEGPLAQAAAQSNGSQYDGFMVLLRPRTHLGPRARPRLRWGVEPISNGARHYALAGLPSKRRRTKMGTKRAIPNTT